MFIMMWNEGQRENANDQENARKCVYVCVYKRERENAKIKFFCFSGPEMVEFRRGCEPHNKFAAGDWSHHK